MCVYFFFRLVPKEKDTKKKGTPATSPDPYGHYLTKPVWDEETIIYAELDMSLPAACKMEHDAIGHYARPDILELKVNEK